MKVLDLFPPKRLNLLRAHATKVDPLVPGTEKHAWWTTNDPSWFSVLHNLPCKPPTSIYREHPRSAIRFARTQIKRTKPIDIQILPDTM